MMVGIGMFANVHHGQMQAEHRNRPLHLGQQALGDHSAGVGAQRGGDDLELGEQFGTTEVIAAGHVARAGVHALTRVDQLAPHARQLESIRLGGIHDQHPRIEFWQVLQVVRDRGS